MAVNPEQAGLTYGRKFQAFCCEGMISWLEFVQRKATQKKSNPKEAKEFCDKQDPHPTIFRNGNVLPNSLINILIKRL